MVLQKRLDYGFNGYQVPAIPRASRSARGKSLFKRKVDNNKMCAFDLLATVAGKLLQEKETSLIGNNLSSGGANSSVGKEIIKKEQPYEKKPFKQELCDQGSCDESVSAFHGRLQGHTRNRSSMGYSYSRYDVSLKLASAIPKSDISEKIAFLEESTGKTRNEFGDSLGTSHCNSSAEKSSPGVAESHRGKVEEEAEKQLQAEDKKVGIVKNETLPNIYSSDYPMESDSKPPTLVSSDSSVEVPICGDRVPRGGSFPRCQDNAIVNRDDDENSSVSTQPSTITMNTFRPSRIGDRRMRKFLGSKYWKVTPAMLKDGNLSSFDMEMKPSFRSRKMLYTRQRTQRGSSFKRRKLFERCSMSTSDKGRSSGVAKSHEKVKNVEAAAPGATIVHRASETSSSLAGQKSSFGSEDSHVKLHIKSFKVPELFIEIPENATVGSLKRTVLETITAIFGRGLRVGVLLQGKKVRDDNKTLIQTGICHDDKLDKLGFTLEPNPALSPPSPICSEDTHFIPPCEAAPHLTRYPSLPAIDQGVSDATPDLPLTNSSNCVESNHDLVPSPIDMSLDKTSPDSRALVAIPPLGVEALAVVPLHRKSRRSELVQRRIRRPFSVTEVEALVQAVEKLGTGRWRDVKLRAFENAKHRTYVDLKDKWKTLVHTARISPQQRRGEPVPQELLDRVLSAHAYWSHQQAKLQVKQQGGDSC